MPRFETSRFVGQRSNEILTQTSVDLSGGVFKDDFSLWKKAVSQWTLTTDMKVTGEAGNVMDLSDGCLILPMA